MGWKSTIDITRKEAIMAIRSCRPDDLEELSDAQLEKMMYDLNIGDDFDKPYFGHNFNITEDLS